MGMFDKLFGGKNTRQKQLDAQEVATGIRSGQKAKVPKKPKKKKASCGLDPTTGEPRAWYHCK